MSLQAPFHPETRYMYSDLAVPCLKTVLLTAITAPEFMKSINKIRITILKTGLI